MSHVRLDLSDTWARAPVDRTIDWLLAGVLAFMPLALGVVQPWSETITVAAIAALAFCLVLRQTRRDAGLVWTWAYVPMLLFIAVALIQIVPLPASWVSALSPETVELKDKLVGDAASPSEKLTFSFYPHATRHDLQVVLLAAAIFITVLHVYRTAPQVRRLLTAIAVIGGLVGVLALAQYLTGADKLYWTIPMPQGRRPNGPFVHYSHYAQFMNLSMGCAIGLFLVRARAAHPARKLSFRRVFTHLGERDYRFAWWLLSVVLIGILTISLSMSRGGMIAMLIALAVTLVSLSRRQGLGGKKWLAGGVIVLAALGLLYFAFDKISDRLATLHNLPDPTQGRAQIYKDVWQESFPRFPITGMGLGTFEVTYPMFDRSNISALATYADADWVQLLHEMGIIGMALVLLFLAVIVFHYFRATRGSRPTICAAAFGLGFGLLAVIINSFSDYGQHLPAIAALSAVSCALMINLSRWRRPEETTQDEFRTSRAPLPVRVALPVAALAGLCWALPAANAARVADDQWTQVQVAANQLEQDDWAVNDEDLRSLVSQASAAVDADPTDAQHRYWLSVYKWHAIDHPPPVTKPSADDDYTPAAAATEPATPEIDVSKLKPLDDSVPATQPLAPAVAEEVPPPPGPTTLPTEKFPQARAVVAELLETRRVCPTYGPLYSVAGQIRYFALHDPAGADEVELGYQLTRDHPITCFAAALVDGERGDWNAARQKLRRSLELDEGRMVPELVSACLYRLHRPELAVEVAADRLDWLCDVAVVFIRSGQAKATTDDAARRIVAALKAGGIQALVAHRKPGADYAILYGNAGEACEYLNEPVLGIQCYQQALVLDYGNVWCRYGLAKCLFDLGRMEEAVGEARRCLRFDPNYWRAKQLIANAALAGVDIQSAPEKN